MGEGGTWPKDSDAAGRHRLVRYRRGVFPIQPGKPQQNAYNERYNRTVRYAWLARTLFDSVEQVQDMAIRWL